MNNPSKLLASLVYPSILLIETLILLSVTTARADDRLDGTWEGTEKVSLANRSDCPKPNYAMTMPAKLIVAGALFAVVEGYGPGRYTNVQKSFGTLTFEVPNTRRGVLTISADGKTLTEKGSIRRTTTVTSGQRAGATSGQPPQISGKTACLDEITGVFHRVTMPGRNY
jgi:hypothetical protein